MALLLATCLSWTAAVAPARGAAARAQLPRTLLDTRYVAPGGRVLRVHAGDDLQAALDGALPGDQVVLDAGATFTGGFILPKKPGTGVVVVRTSDLGALPEGVCVGPADAAHLARVVTPGAGAAVSAAPGAHGWRLVGIEFTVAPGVAENTGVVRLGEGSESSRLQLPREIVVDRSWVHGIRARTTAAATGLDTLHIFFPGGVFTHNVLVHGDCSLYPAGNFCPPTIGDAGFVDYAGGDCRLAASSPYRGAGTEGADLGADIDVIGAATG